MHCLEGTVFFDADTREREREGARSSSPDGREKKKGQKNSQLCRKGSLARQQQEPTRTKGAADQKKQRAERAMTGAFLVGDLLG